MLSILIITYNGWHHLEPCLQALQEQTLPSTEFEVLVWDNASTDGTAEQMPTRFPEYRYFLSPRNLGFTGGNNAAAQHARGETLVLLNNDTIPDPYWLEELLRVIHRYPGSPVGSKLLLLRDPQMLNSTGLVLLRDGRGADRGFLQQDTGAYEQGEWIFGACGAAWTIPAPPQGVPLFDPRFFMYCEDLDLAWRLTAQGQPTRYAPRAVVLHAVGGTDGHRSTNYWFHSERNRALVAVMNGDPFLAILAPTGLFLRFARALLQAMLSRTQRSERLLIVRALARACLSFVRHLPTALMDRYERRHAKPIRRGKA